MPRIQHSRERWMLKRHLLRLYPHTTMNLENAHIGELCRSILCHEDEVELLELDLKKLKDPQHCSEVLIKYEKHIIAVPGLPLEQQAHNWCTKILTQKITRIQGNLVSINNTLEKRPSASPLAPVNFTSLTPLSSRLVRRLVSSLDQDTLEKDKNTGNNSAVNEAMQRELSLICTVVAGETLDKVERPMGASVAGTEILHSQMPPKKQKLAHSAAESVEEGIRKKRRFDEDKIASVSSSSLPHPGRYPAPSTVAPVPQPSAQPGTTGQSLSNTSTSSRLLRSSHQTSASSSNQTSAASSSQAPASSSSRASATSSNRLLAPKPSSHTTNLGSTRSPGPLSRHNPPYQPRSNPHPHH